MTSASSGWASVGTVVALTVTLRFLVLGDSLAFGTGATGPQDTLGARLTRALTDAGSTVELHVVAVPGAPPSTSPPSSGGPPPSTRTWRCWSSARTT